jgi:hypothetical protein
MEAILSSETLVTTYKSTRHHNPEDHNQQGFAGWRITSEYEN